eukprot:TRINITY_DN47728_c0_g1_i1.p1 TRINITY_DN47728_c0_g1~~TRINITY_DN47728_c0_g1_i1.p1  ORF type:complete len:454 (-),score=76.42 TRINITY_DN47728_c0_g1_i1:368-1729(-)
MQDRLRTTVGQVEGERIRTTVDGWRRQSEGALPPASPPWAAQEPPQASMQQLMTAIFGSEEQSASGSSTEVAGPAASSAAAVLAGPGNGAATVRLYDDPPTEQEAAALAEQHSSWLGTVSTARMAGSTNANVLPHGRRSVLEACADLLLSLAPQEQAAESPQSAAAAPIQTTVGELSLSDLLDPADPPMLSARSSSSSSSSSSYSSGRRRPQNTWAITAGRDFSVSAGRPQQGAPDPHRRIESLPSVASGQRASEPRRSRQIPPPQRIAPQPGGDAWRAGGNGIYGFQPGMELLASQNRFYQDVARQAGVRVLGVDAVGTVPVQTAWLAVPEDFHQEMHVGMPNQGAGTSPATIQPPAGADPQVWNELPRNVQVMLNVPAEPELEEEEEELVEGTGAQVCIVCASRRANATFVHGNTGHTTCCMRCAREIQRRGNACPVCRAPFTMIIHNFSG